MYQTTKTHVTNAVLPAIVRSGALADELTATGLGVGPFSIGATGDVIDERIIPETPTTGVAWIDVYSGLQALRSNAHEARGLLQKYAPASSPALRGEMYALEGYANLILAELFCSGVPLSTLDFEKDFTYKPSSTTADVTRQAITLFDSALAISSDSVSILSLARVGKGRALVDLGDYAGAAQAVGLVPTDFQYTVPFGWGYGDSTGAGFRGFSVANSEGQNGLPLISANDPRVLVNHVANNAFGRPIYTPAKYGASGGVTAHVVLSSGIEAQLIRAEAALHANANDGTWLNILNVLRTTCAHTTGCPTPAPAGTGKVAGLPPLSDPGQVDGNDSARVTLLFAERAYWLFLTTARQGDLRRLVRNYGRAQDAIYPTGAYYGGYGAYGTDVNLPIPAEERANPQFHGCLDRRA